MGISCFNQVSSVFQKRFKEATTVEGGLHSFIRDLCLTKLELKILLAKI